MPIDHEDTQTDISGTPPPAKPLSAREVHQAVQGTVGHSRAPQPQAPPKQPPEQAAPQQAPDLAQQPGGKQPGLPHIPQAPPLSESILSGYKPVDWKAEVERDPAQVWALLRHAGANLSAFVDSNAAHQSMSLIMQQADARVKAIEGGIIDVNKLASLVEHVAHTADQKWQGNVIDLFKRQDPGSQVLQQGAGIVSMSPGTVFGDIGDANQVLRGQMNWQEAKQRLLQREQGDVESAPGRAAQAGLMIAQPETVAGKLAVQAGMLAPIVPELLSADPHAREDPLTWLIVASSMLGILHIPGPLREQMTRLLGDRWPQIEGWLHAADDARQKADQAQMDPQKRSQQVVDYIERALQVGAMTPYSKVVKAAAGPEREIPALVGPSGEIRLMAGEQAKKLQKGLAKLGVTDVEGLIAKAGAEGGLSGKAAKWVAKNWQALGMPYDLVGRMPGETDLRNPQAHLATIADEAKHADVVNHITALNSLLGEAKRGLFTNGDHPAAAIFRSFAGSSRNLDRVFGRYVASIFHALGPWAEREENGVAFGKAIEGDSEAYDSLPTEAKAVADGFGLLRAWLREDSQGTKYAKNFVPNWFPRVDTVRMVLARGRPTTGTVLAREARKQRALALSVDPESGQLQQTLRFGTVQASNEALAKSRAAMQSALTDASQPLPADLADNAEARAIRRLAEGGNAAEARSRAAQMAFDRYPSKDENFLRSLGAVRYQMRSILTAKAIEQLKAADVMTTHARSGAAIAAKALVEPKDSRHLDELLNSGYVRLTDSKFRGVVAERNFAKLLDRYVNHVSAGGLAGGLKNVPVFKQLLAVERLLVKAIMYSPAIHGVNMLGRLGMAATLHQLDFLHYLLNGKDFADPAEAEAGREALRSEAVASGLPLDFKKSQWADWVVGSMHDALGDIESDMPEAASLTNKKSIMESLIPKVARDHSLNQWFWGKVYDFGVMMYHLEKQDALAAGRPEEWSRLWAGRRAMSWMGAVSPEDTNPLLHDASRLLAFAPNWWRTWAELMIPIYKRSGLFTDPAAATFAAKQAAKTAMAAFAFQKMSGEALNLFFSGHLQDQNTPGNQDRIEIRRPAMIRTLQQVGLITSDPNSSQYIDPETGENQRTGAVLSMENPFARQQYATETLLGFQSGHPGTEIGPKAGPFQLALPGSPQDVTDGLTTFAVSRVSPLVDSLAGAFNLDLYGTATSGTMRGVVHDEPAGKPNPLSVLTSVLYSLPGAQQFTQNIQQPQDPAHPQSDVSILGTTMPRGVSDTVHALPDVGARTVLAAFTGINTPTARAQKTPGQQLSDADYQKIAQTNTDYQKAMLQNEAEAASGQSTPYLWRQRYSELSKEHTAQMQALYKGAPEYVNGGDALASKWDALYDQATTADGSIDQAKLAQLQAEFHASHSRDQMAQMNAILRQNDTRYPMLKMYHQVLDGYDSWQSEWAQRHGIDIVRLRGEIAAYNSLYSRGTVLQHQYLAAHPDLIEYRMAVKTEWDQTAMGLVYSLFYGRSAAIRRATALNISEQQLQQAVSAQAEQQPQQPPPPQGA